jgi:hypothetical protein
MVQKEASEMPKSRVSLHEKLEELLGSEAVYYQPPASVKLSYPAIIYTRNRIQNRHANNEVYGQNISYTVTVIDRNPDSEIVQKVSLLPMCAHDRHYAAENLNHDVFTLYY